MFPPRRLPMHILTFRGAKNVQRRSKTTSISELQAAFRDPSSPYYIPPGTQGPEAADSPSRSYGFNYAAINAVDGLGKAHQKLIEEGFDPQSLWEQRIVWGDYDAFQHVNNVRYVRFFESARIKWMYSIGHELGGPEKADAMLKGKGVSLILKSIEVKFRRPVNYPDTLVIGHKPRLPPGVNPDNSAFELVASAYSVAQEAFVAHTRESLVWYDYDRLKKCDPGERAREVVFGRSRGR